MLSHDDTAGCNPATPTLILTRHDIQTPTLNGGREERKVSSSRSVFTKRQSPPSSSTTAILGRKVGHVRVRTLTQAAIFALGCSQILRRTYLQSQARLRELVRSCDTVISLRWFQRNGVKASRRVVIGRIPDASYTHYSRALETPSESAFSQAKSDSITCFSIVRFHLHRSLI